MIISTKACCAEVVAVIAHAYDSVRSTGNANASVKDVTMKKLGGDEIDVEPDEISDELRRKALQSLLLAGSWR